MKQITYVDDFVCYRLKIKSIAHARDDEDFFLQLIRDDMDLVENDVDTLHEEIEHLVCHLVGNDVNTLHEEKII
jgi:hypothetical protein